MITESQAKAIRRCTFPGGYSPWKTRGDCKFNWHRAKAAIDFFGEHLQHIKGDLAGKPLLLERWQQNIIGTLFGWMRPDGLRRYRKAYVEVPRKSGKSTIAFGVALLLLYLDGEPGAEVYSCAAETEQASIVFSLAKENVLRNPALARCSTPYGKSITYKDPGTGVLKGSYRVLSADAHTKHGYNPHGIIFDELHAQPNAELWNVMNTGTGARSQPLTLAITTAGSDRESVCYQEHEYAGKVRDGIVDDETLLPVIYAAAADDDWTSPKTWRKAQPNLGVSVKPDFYERECKRAQANPAFENTFKRLYLNIWTEQETRAIPMEQWDACCDQPRQSWSGWLEERIDELHGRVCYGGLDMASRTDVAAFVLVFPDDSDSGGFDVIPFLWSTEEMASTRSRQPNNAGLYQMWANAGLMTLCDGSRIDPEMIRQQVVQCAEWFQLRDVGYDQWNVEAIRLALEQDGIEMFQFAQTLRNFNEPTKELLSLVTEGKLRHGGHPVLRWMASNLSVLSDANGNIRPHKKSSGDKIDGIVSLIMAIGRSMFDDSPGPSIYETPGSLML